VLTYELPKTWRFASGLSIPTPIFPVSVSTTAFEVLPTPLNVILSTSVNRSCPLVDISTIEGEYFLAKWGALWRKCLLGWGRPLNLGGLTFVVYSYCLCIKYISKGLAI
jgi:hypothetical protein